MANYLDSGLFGFHVVAQAEDMGKVLPGIRNLLRGEDEITDADVQKAK